MNENPVKVTIESLQGVWDKIQSRLPSAPGQLFLRAALPGGCETSRLSAVIRVADAMPGLLVQIPEGMDVKHWSHKHFAGVRFDSIIKIDGGYGLPLMLVDPAAKHIFALLAADIARIATGEKSASAQIDAILKCLALWRRFFQSRSGKLSEEEVRGLIGEISVLCCLLTAQSADACLDAWRGPRGELHDFRLSKFRIEVKSWSNESRPRIFISDPSQIVVDETDPVWIAAVQISKSGTHGRTLADWVQAPTSTMDSGQLEIYNSLLADYGFLGAQAELYTERYAVVQPVFYRVTATFPRIDLALIPAPICAVKYAIELNGLSGHIEPSPISREAFGG